MATKNMRVELVIPAAGVRKDVEPFNMEPEMLDEGQNVLVDKRVLRPRPAHAYEGWKPTEGWWRGYTEDSSISIAYKSTGTILAFIEGSQIGWSDDEFETVTMTTWPGIGTIPKIIRYDPVNNYWIVACTNGDLYTAPDTWPGTGTWTRRVNMSDNGKTTLVDFLYIPFFGVGRGYAICSEDNGYAAQGYHGVGPINWDEDDEWLGNQGGKLYGVWYDSGGLIYAVARMIQEELVVTPADLYVIEPADWGTKPWTKKLESNRIVNFLDAVCSPASNAGFILERLPDASRVLKTTNLGATYTTQISLSDPDAFQRLFRHLSTGDEAMVAIGNVMYCTADGTTWVEYAAPPFTATIYDAAHDGTRWWFSTSAGIWRSPSVNLADMQHVNSMAQWQSDSIPHDLVSATEGEWRRLNQSTLEWENIPQNADYPTAGTDPVITAGAKRNRWVFRQFWMNSHYYLLGANTANNLMVLDPEGCDGSPAAEGIREAQGNPGKPKIVLVAAGRVVIANLGTSEPFAVDSSDHVTDGGFDSGWGGLNYVLLGDTPGAIVAGQEISSLQFVIFKEDAVYHGIAQVEFGGVASPFRFELIKTGIQGPVSPHSLARLPDGSIMYFGRDAAIYLYDGQGCQDVGKHVRYALEGIANLDSLEDVIGWYDRERRLVWFFYPSTSGLMNRGIIVSPENYAAWDVVLPEMWNVACGDIVFLGSQGSRWNEMNILWREAGSLTWAAGVATDFFPLLGLEEDIWMRHRWDDATDYTDLGRAIECCWRPGYAYLSELDRYSTLHDIRHIMPQFESGESFTVSVKGYDDEQFEASRGAMTGMEAGTNISSQFERDATLTSLSDEHRTEFDITALNFRYQVCGSIRRRFQWAGGVARFRPRGLR